MSKVPLKKPQFRPRMTPAQTFQASLGAGVLAIILQLVVIGLPEETGILTIFRVLFVTLFAMYIPTLFDGREGTLEGGYNAKITEDPWWGKNMFTEDSDLIFDGEKIEYGKQYIVSMSPHGVGGFVHWFLATTRFFKLFPKRRTLAGEVVFRVPLWRDIMLAAGAVSASKKVTEGLLREGYSVALMPGGISEQNRAQLDDHLIFIRKRTGIFYYALKYQVPVVPFYNFTENSLFYTSNLFASFRNWMADTFNVPMCLAFPIIARFFKIRVRVVAGNPLLIPIKGDVPSADEVSTLHKMYIDEVERIFNKYKEQEGYPNSELKIL